MLKVFEEFLQHPKWERLEPDPELWSACVSVWLAAALDCRMRLTDGAISKARLRRLTPLPPKRVDDVSKALVRVGFWEKQKDGFQFHDWSDVQETKEQVKARRQRDRKRKKQERKRKLSAVDSSTESECDPCADSREESGTPLGKGLGGEEKTSLGLEDVGQIYCRETGNEDLPVISAEWRERDEKQHLRRMLQWCLRKSDPAAALAEQFRIGMSDPFLAAGQPLHVWAKRIGTLKQNGATKAPAGVSDWSTADLDGDDFDQLGVTK